MIFCEVCGNEFNKPLNLSRKYCSINCRMKKREERKYISVIKIKEINIKERRCMKCDEEINYGRYCGECNKKILEQKNIKRLEYARNYSKKYLKSNKNNKEFKRKRNERFKIYFKERWDNDKEFRISCRLRNNLYMALRRYSISGKSVPSKKYGIDYPAIIEKLKPFPEGLENYHVDHIKPLISFDLNNEEEIKKAFAPENLQLLLAKDNLKKGSKIINNDKNETQLQNIKEL